MGNMFYSQYNKEQGAQAYKLYIQYGKNRTQIIPQKVSSRTELFKKSNIISKQNYIDSLKVDINPEQNPEDKDIANENLEGYEKELIKNPNETHIIILGDQSAGKRSFINYCVNQNLKRPSQQFLQQPIKYYSNNNNVIWYCQLDWQYERCAPASINFFKKADYIFILYPSTLKLIENRIKLAAKALPNKLIFIRTKCDQFETQKKLKKTCEEEIQADKQNLRKYGIDHQDKVYAFSVKNNLEYRDNKKVKDIILEAMKIK